MGIRAREIGREFQLYVGVDISNNTSLEIILTAPDGTKTTIPSSRVTAPDVPGGDVTTGPIPADQYMQFITNEDDFPVSGTWMACGILNNGPTIQLSTAMATYEIGESCL